MYAQMPQDRNNATDKWNIGQLRPGQKSLFITHSLTHPPPTDPFTDSPTHPPTHSLPPHSLASSLLHVTQYPLLTSKAKFRLASSSTCILHCTLLFFLKCRQLCSSVSCVTFLCPSVSSGQKEHEKAMWFVCLGFVGEGSVAG